MCVYVRYAGGGGLMLGVCGVGGVGCGGGRIFFFFFLFFPFFFGCKKCSLHTLLQKGIRDRINPDGYHQRPPESTRKSTTHPTPIYYMLNG